MLQYLSYLNEQVKNRNWCLFFNNLVSWCEVMRMNMLYVWRMLWQWECGSTFFDTLRHALFHHSVVTERGHLPLKNRQSTLEKVPPPKLFLQIVYIMINLPVNMRDVCLELVRPFKQWFANPPAGNEDGLRHRVSLILWTVVWLFALSQEILFTSSMTQSKSFGSQLIH